MTTSTPGPDLVLAGAARSGTSSLAARLGSHPGIDAGSVKESNYFSRAFDRGVAWYDSLYEPRTAGLLRLDASTSYTSPLYPEALGRLAAAAPDALVVYGVRHPIQRAVSHYLYRHHHLHIDDSADFGAALHASQYYEGGSDYSHWLPMLISHFGDRLLVVPFELVTRAPHEVTDVVYRQAGLPHAAPADAEGQLHRNNVVTYRSDTARHAARLLRRSRLYPRLRGLVGANRMRTARGLVTREATLPSEEEALASCDEAQRGRLRRLEERAGAAVYEHLVAQDERLDLTWATRSFAAGASGETAGVEPG